MQGGEPCTLRAMRNETRRGSGIEAYITKKISDRPVSIAASSSITAIGIFIAHLLSSKRELAIPVT